MCGGFRTGVLQVMATVSVVAYINLGGLGRYLFDGLAVQRLTARCWAVRW